KKNKETGRNGIFVAPWKVRGGEKTGEGFVFLGGFGFLGGGFWVGGRGFFWGGRGKKGVLFFAFFF
ncbi:hypothetical protein, partial [Enterococcus faecium]